MSTARNLREVDSRTLFEVGYVLMQKHSVLDKETADARRSFDKAIRDKVIEDETGVPAAVRDFASADASRYLGGGEKK